MKSSRRDVLVGFLFIGAIAAIGYLTIVIKGFSYLTRPRLEPVIVTFDDVVSLEEGEEVRARGVKIGQVTGIKYDEEGQVEVEVTFFQWPRLYKNCSFHIRSKSPLGGKYVAIDPGFPEDPAHPEADLLKPEDLTGKKVKGEPATDLFTELGDIIGEERDNISGMIENLRDMTQAIRDQKGPVGALIYNADMKENLNRMVKELASAVYEPKGLAYTLLNDRTMAANVSDIVARLKTAISRSDTPLGVLINDPETGGKLKRTVSDLAELTRQIREGKGTLGRIFADQTLYNEAVSTVKGLGRIAEGQGAVPWLISDPESREQTRHLLRNLRDITVKLNEGDGTIARLINDPAVYDHAEKLLVQIREAVEDARENAPVNQLVNLLGAVY